MNRMLQGTDGVLTSFHRFDEVGLTGRRSTNFVMPLARGTLVLFMSRALKAAGERTGRRYLDDGVQPSGTTKPIFWLAAVQICQALGGMHAKGVFHRGEGGRCGRVRVVLGWASHTRTPTPFRLADIKPDNILVLASTPISFVVGDFGREWGRKPPCSLATRGVTAFPPLGCSRRPRTARSLWARGHRPGGDSRLHGPRDAL